MNDFDALVAVVRENYSAYAWLHDCSSLERDMAASFAAKKYGTTPLDFRKDPGLIRAVETSLKFPPRVHVCLGPTACAECFCIECGQPYGADDSCENGECVVNSRHVLSGRDHRGWVRK